MLLKRIFQAIILSAIYISQTIAQGTSIKGTVKDASTGETLIGCNVQLQGTTVGSTTDLDGNFEIKNIKPGTYNLVASFISYNPKIEKVSVEKDASFTIDFKLDAASVVLNDVTITATKRNDTELSMISSIKASSLVVTGIASQQIAKSQDRDASEVIKRIPGVTVIDNRFVMVRGLSERYNNVILNNAPAPSSETDIRAFSFDVIPSSMIERLQVYKTPAPELPGDFAGGAIKISTKNIPDNDGISFTFSGSYLNGTTNKDFQREKTGKYHMLGFDDGSHSLPSGFPEYLKYNTSADSITMLSRKMNKNWSPDTIKAPIDFRASVNLSKRFIFGNTTIGNITAINYSNTNSTKAQTRSFYEEGFNTTTQLRNMSWRYTDNQYSNNTKIGVLHNWSVAIGANNKLELRNFYNHIGNTKTTIRQGYDYSNTNTAIKGIQYNFMERNVYSGQLGGSHQLSDNNDNIEWSVGYSYANRNEPDVKRFSWALQNDPEMEFYNKYYALIQRNADPRFAGRLFMNSVEHIKNIVLNYEHKFMFSQNFNPVLKAGIYAENKNRAFDARLLGFVSNTYSTLIYQPIDTIFLDRNINTTNGIYLQEKTNPSDSYDASNKIQAGYIAFDIPITKKIKIYTGVRVEYNEVELNSFSSDFGKIPVNAKIESTDFFPSINTTYNFTDKALMRLAYGKTINRPEFRELAPFAFYDFEMASTVMGNDSLKNATIHNFDLRFEYYPGANEIITIGAFYKRFINPIESTITPSGSDINYSFQNAQEATSKGLEVEVRKSLSTFENNSFLFFLKDISIVFNGALINSEVVFDSTQNKFGESNRPMQGQSPYIVNAGLYYNNEKIGLQVNVLYNIIGERIIYVGNQSTPDIYELPRNLLDISFTKKIGKHIQVKGGIQDILHNRFINQQTFMNAIDSDIADTNITTKQNTLEYNTGTYYTLGVTINF
jgi:hypothetical protein